MTLRNYCLLCGAGSIATVLSILYVPGVADAFENILLLFLMTNAN